MGIPGIRAPMAKKNTVFAMAGLPGIPGFAMAPGGPGYGRRGVQGGEVGLQLLPWESEFI